MNSNLARKVESHFIRWEKGLFTSYGVVFTMLIYALIKAQENTLLADMLFYIEQNTEVINSPAFSPYHYRVDTLIVSPWRILLLLIAELIILACAATLAFHPAWRTITFTKRINLVFGYLLAAWVGLLSFGAQNSHNVDIGYNLLASGYILALILGYWWLRYQKDRAEEVFP